MRLTWAHSRGTQALRKEHEPRPQTYDVYSVFVWWNFVGIRIRLGAKLGFMLTIEHESSAPYTAAAE